MHDSSQALRLAAVDTYMEGVASSMADTALGTTRSQQPGLLTCSGRGCLLQASRNGQSHHSRLLRDKLGGQLTKEEVSWYYLDPQVLRALDTRSSC